MKKPRFLQKTRTSTTTTMWTINGAVLNIQYDMGRGIRMGMKLLIPLILLSLHLTAQDGYKSEADLIKGATELFDQASYTKAMPLYSQLVSLYPKNTEYNMKYGVCLYYGDADKSAGLKYLKYAVSKNDADVMANYYYARTLHGNYNFSAAIKYYGKFKNAAKPKSVEDLQVDRQIAMCDNGKALLVHLFELNVLEKKDIGRSEFFRIYEINDLGGKIIVKPDQFKSKLDLKSSDFSLIHLPDEARVIYYSSYGEAKGNGKDIFRSRKTAEGEWGPPENVGSQVNSRFDEDFPFMHPDGTLYFASRGHNSMGGYDLFKSVYNESTNTWSAPENLNFPVNSPFDDILFISDSKGQLAYFASERTAVENKITVYRVQISRKPFEAAFLSGNFIAENSENVKSAKISIFDLEENKKVGTYFTDPESGSYNIQLPKGGRSYKFVVETGEQSPVHTGKVDIPAETGNNSLRQEIRLVGSGEGEKLVIKNLFDESSRQPVSDDDLMALLRDASSMEVNATISDIRAQAGQPEPSSPPASEPASEVSLGQRYDALLSEANTVVAELGKNTDRLKAQIAYGFRYSQEKANMADKLYEDLEVTRQRMINEQDENKKKALLDELIVQKEKLEPVASDAIVSYDFTASLANEYDEKLRDRDALREDLNGFRAGGKPSDNQELAARNRKMDERLKDQRDMNSAFDIAPKRYADMIQSAGDKLTRQAPYYEDLKRDISTMQAAIARLESEISAGKSNKARDQKMAEKGAKEIDLEDMEFQFKDVRKKYLGLKLEKKNLEADARQLASFIAKVRNAPAQTSQMSSDEQAELKKLIDYFKEQRLIEDVIGEEVEVLLAGTEQKQDFSTASSYPAVDNAGNPLNYDEQYLVNLAGIELIADAVKKNEERARLYRNWSETVADEQRIQENHLSFTNKSSEKQIIQERIKILDDKKVEYKVKAEEYRVQALALAGGEKPAGAPSPAASEITAPVAVKTTASASAPKFNDSGNKGLGSVVSGVGHIAASGKTTEEISAGYKGLLDKTKSEGRKEVSGMKAAAVELNWAATLEQVIAQKEETRSGRQGTEAEVSAREIDDLRKEQAQHLKAAGGEFAKLEMDRFVKGKGLKADPALTVPFDPAARDDDRYEVKFEAGISAVELDYRLNDLQKSEQLAQIHSNWTQTIQEEIIHLSSEASGTQDKNRQKEMAGKLKELQVARDLHLERSNYHYEKIMEAAVALADVAASKGTTESAPEDRPVELSAPETGQVADRKEQTVPGQTAEGRKTVDDLRRELQQSLTATTATIGEKERALQATKGKAEKQQLSLELALLNLQKSQEEQAQADIGTAGRVPLLNAEADRALAQGMVNWQEEAKDYVFENKDFSKNIPSGSDAASAYLEAKRLYEEVQRLEAEKLAMIGSKDIIANAELTLLQKQAVIEETKIRAYLKLSEATNKEFLENKKNIEALIAATGKDLKSVDEKLYRQNNSAEVIYQEVGKYQATAAAFKSNSLKFDVFDQAQFMGEYVLSEQKKIVDALRKTTTGELAFLSAPAGGGVKTQETDEFAISRADHDRLVTLPAFIEYEKDKAAIAALQKERLELEARVESENTLLNDLRSRRDSITKAAEGLSGGKRKKRMAEAEVIDVQIAAQQRRSDSLSLAMVQLGEREKLVSQNSERLLRSQRPEDRQRIMLLAEVRSVGAEPSAYIRDESLALKTGTADTPVAVAENPVPEERPRPAAPQRPSPVVSEKPAPAAGGSVAVSMEDREFLQKATEIPKQLENDLFIRPVSSNNITPYSASKPIPIDEAIPAGLIFKVQVGAFRNPIPQDLFKGFAPVMGERIPNGITRYTAGLFRDFANANRAKNEIRRMGYGDAFVVAFMDGKRVSFQELQDLPDLDLTVPQAVLNEGTGVPQEVLSRPSDIRDAGQVSSAIAEQTQNTREVKGVFFTVQVGVYTNTLLPDRLRGIRELNSELLGNGNIRYSAGQFRTLEDARLRRDQVVSQGIGDAFVTAYADGERIGVGEALKILEGGR